MPRPVWIAAVLLIGSLLPGWLSPLSDTAATVRLFTSIFVAALALAVMLRKNAARYIVAASLIVGLISLVIALAAGRTTSLLGLAITLVQLVATIMLFHPSATTWFRSRPSVSED